MAFPPLDEDLTQSSIRNLLPSWPYQWALGDTQQR